MNQIFRNPTLNSELKTLNFLTPIPNLRCFLKLMTHHCIRLFGLPVSAFHIPPMESSVTLVAKTGQNYKTNPIVIIKLMPQK